MRYDSGDILVGPNPQGPKGEASAAAYHAPHVTHFGWRKIVQKPELDALAAYNEEGRSAIRGAPPLMAAGAGRAPAPVMELQPVLVPEGMYERKLSVRIQGKDQSKDAPY